MGGGGKQIGTVNSSQIVETPLWSKAELQLVVGVAEESRGLGQVGVGGIVDEQGMRSGDRGG